MYEKHPNFASKRKQNMSFSCKIVRKSCETIKKYPLSCLCIAIIWVLCFCTPPHTPLDNVAFMDKWTHIVMYAGTCSMIWLEYIKNHGMVRKTDNQAGPKAKSGNIKEDKTSHCRRLFIMAWLAPVLMSGLIEILQAYCTGGRRSGDWLDFAANTAGATLAAVAGIAYLLHHRKKVFLN